MWLLAGSCSIIDAVMLMLMSNYRCFLCYFWLLARREKVTKREPAWLEREVLWLRERLSDMLRRDCLDSGEVVRLKEGLCVTRKVNCMWIEVFELRKSLVWQSTQSWNFNTVSFIKLRSEVVTSSVTSHPLHLNRDLVASGVAVSKELLAWKRLRE